MIGPVLVTGGTGKTGRRVAARLAAAGIDACIGTRSPHEPQHLRFAWGDLSCAEAFDGGAGRPMPRGIPSAGRARAHAGRGRSD